MHRDIPNYFRNCGGRCAFPLSSVSQPPEKTLALLSNIPGLRILNNDYRAPILVSECLPAFARQYIGVSRYQRDAAFSNAPMQVNCSSFVKYLYYHMGVSLPHLAVQQSEVGKYVMRDSLTIGDLVFLTGRINRYRTNPDDSVGHVALVVGPSRYLHACNRGVTECTEHSLLKKREFRVARRYVAAEDHVILLQCDPYLEIETADDIYWLLTRFL